MNHASRLALAATAAALTSLPSASYCGPDAGTSGLWHDVRFGDEAARVAAGSMGRALVGPSRTLSLDTRGFASFLDQVPMEGSGARPETGLLALPLPEGGFGRFRVEESPIMEPGLAVTLPEIRTFRGQGIDDPTATLRFDWTPDGFHAIALSAERTLYIDPFARGDVDHYVVYDKSHYRRSEPVPFRCQTTGDEVSEESLRDELRQAFAAAAVPTGLRTYRLALAADAEYTAFFGGATQAMSAMVTAMTRVNAIYEREVGVRLNIIAGDQQLVYTDPATDPYTNTDGVAMLCENQKNIDTVITRANYDIGHVFSTGGGGVAGLGVVCNGTAQASDCSGSTGIKARGVTGLPQPVGDPFYVDFVAHEMGHQFGANHTFNASSPGNCGAANQRNASTAYEPGSGSTIMSYAGSCGSENVQARSDDYFHAISLQEIGAFLGAAGSTCSGAGGATNTAPTVTAPATLTIPKLTPFTLTASGATDPDAGDAARLTFDWEQFDLGAAAPPDTDNGSRPIFRSFLPTASTSRTFPSLANILKGTNAGPFEALPTIARTLHFRVTARDNHTGNGGTSFATTSLNVIASAGPFAVTAPAKTGTVWVGNTSQPVSWAVNGTDQPPVSCLTVNVSLSLDSGQTFPIPLATGVPNAPGAATVTAPGLLTGLARVKVACATNIFFDISDGDFKIVPSGISVSDAPAVTEGNSGTVIATFTVSLTSAPSTGQTVVVHYATANGTASAPSDYVATSGNLTFNVGETTKTVDVSVNGDTLFETAETFVLNLSSPSANAGIVDGQGLATILNDDPPPSVSIADVAVTEGNAGTKNAAFIVSLSTVSGAPASAGYAIGPGGTATPGTDYTAVSGTLTIPVGALTGKINIPIKGDAFIEADETFFVDLSSPVNATILDGQGQGTILNDDAPGTFEFSAAGFKVSEAAGFATITVKRVNGNAAGATVDYSTFDGTATGAAGSSQDYSPIVPGTLTFAANKPTATFKVPITKDTADEGNETVLLRLSNPQPAAFGAALGAQTTAVLTITDNDTGGKIRFSSANYSVSEGAGSVKLTVRRSGGLASGVTVAYTVSPVGPVPATDGADYDTANATPQGGTPPSGVVTFASSGAGAATQTITIPITQDLVAEGAETFTVTLSAPTGGAGLGSIPVATVTILDDEPTVEFSASNYNAKESQPSALITVKRSGPPVGVVMVSYATADSTAVSTGPSPDYVPASGTLTFPNGISTRTFTVPIVKDTLVEGPETVDLSLGSPVGIVTGAKTTTTLTIADDDATPTLQFSAGSYTVNEATPKATLMVKRVGNTTHQVSVDYVIQGTSTATGADYTLAPFGTLTFNPGVVTQTILVPITNDAIDEGTETVDLHLQNALDLTSATSALVGTLGDATLHITDNETTVQFSAAAYSVSEAAKILTVSVRRTGDLTAVSTVQFDVSGGSANRDTGSGGDYKLNNVADNLPGTLTFLAGQAVRTFTINLNADTVSEGAETIDLQLSSPTSAKLGTPDTAIVTLRDNDIAGKAQFSAANYSAPEDGGTALITVTRTGGTSSQATLLYTVTSGGTANPASGVDFDALSNVPLVFNQNEKTKTFAVTVHDNGIPDSGAVSVDLILDTPTNGLALGATSTATLWIVRE